MFARSAVISIMRDLRSKPTKQKTKEGEMTVAKNVERVVEESKEERGSKITRNTSAGVLQVLQQLVRTPCFLLATSSCDLEGVRITSSTAIYYSISPYTIPLYLMRCGAAWQHEN